ncbi:hypothetical protein CBM2614_A10045 [Cupriavidus taiwanensis]|nr:hypothetical protein CBM2614_A10045 [Cupriavidus taiwanensis]
MAYEQLKARSPLSMGTLCRFGFTLGT